MAFDGLCIAAITKECNEKIINSRIYKIAQPEKDELILTLKAQNGTYRLFLSADASLPLIYFCGENKQSPMNAPNFCMLLRKHLQNGRIVAVRQPSLERIVCIDIEHLNELGDLCQKTLIIELMGKHSNIIFCDSENKIIDSIKHISGMVSSVREVLPGRTYFIPDTMEKKNPLETDFKSFCTIFEKSTPLFKALYTSFTGFSPVISQEICYRANVDSDLPANVLSDLQKDALFKSFAEIIKTVSNGIFTPAIYEENGIPKEFSVLPLSTFSHCETKEFDSISGLLEHYYATKNKITRIRQKSIDLRKVVQNTLEKDIKKYDLQLKQIADTQKREKYRIYGELINTYGYGVAPGSKEFTANNYYTGEDIVIPLDPTLTPSENAKKYFEKYNKLKRTYEALSELTIQVKEEIDHLESILSSLDIALMEEDLLEIRLEMEQYGYLKKKYQGKGNKSPKITSKPFHYLSSDGYHMYVGKNNFQNEELTFKVATGNDWWFHAKGVPGSHVIVKANNEELPDRTFEEAARLAAFYSKAKDQDKVEIDYIQKKHIKKPAGGKPGFVIYHTNYSMMIDAKIDQIEIMQ